MTSPITIRASSSGSLEGLPFFPQPFQKRPRKDAAAQLAVIRGLLASAHCVVNAGDPDAEGQLLIDEILDHFQWQGETLRLLMNDNNTDVVKKALRDLRPNGEFRGLRDAADARGRADQLVGF